METHVVEFALVSGGEEGLGHVLGEKGERRVHVDRKVRGDVVELLALRLENGAIFRRAELVERRTLPVKRALDDNLAWVLFGVVRGWAVVQERDDDGCLPGRLSAAASLAKLTLPHGGSGP